MTDNLHANEGFQTELVPTPIQNVVNTKVDTESCFQEPDRTKELNELFSRLWGAADELRANSKLRSTQYSTPVLGILFLRYAFHRFEEATKRLEKKYVGRDRPIRKLDYQAEGAIYLTEKARYRYLLELPEGASIGKAIDDAMRSIEDENEELRDVLPKVYTNMEDSVLINLLKIFHKIPTKLDRDIFGKIYEYFIAKFAMSEGQRGGEFFTPTSIVRLIVEVLEPYHGRILDPACGSGGMFVQSAEFVKDHLKNPYKEISIYGQEKADDTVRLCKMNLAIHGLSGDIRQGNTYYEDVFNMRGKFDFVMANPPFNVNNVDKEAIKGDPRYRFGLPTVDNANYLWIQVFYSMLNENGRAGFVMANSASDVRYSEYEIRKKLIEKRVVDVIISVASNFFYTVTLPVTLWFLNNEKKKTVNKNKVLFIDAREIYNQIDRAHREFTPQQIEFLSNIARLYRGLEIETSKCSSSMIKEHFPELKYQDIKGLCKIADIEEIEKQDYSLNPGRYVETKKRKDDEYDFQEKLSSLNKKLEILNEESRELENQIAKNVNGLLSNEMNGNINWKKVKLEDIAQVVGGGTPSRKVEEYFGGQIPWLSPRDLSNHYSRYIEKGKENITKNGLKNSSAKLLPKDTIVYSSRATIGNIAIAKNPISTSQGFRNFICNKKLVDVDFLYYALIYDTPQIIKIASGATYKEISGRSLKKFKVLLPPIDEQKKIAFILSTYDDLIEVNNQRIKSLENIAQAVYNEWFVHFRYLGHEYVETIQTPYGLIPKGWTLTSLKKIFPNEKVVMTGPFGSKLHAFDYRENGVPLILVKHVKNGRIIEQDMPLVGKHKFPELDRYLLQTEDIVVTRVGYVGDSAYIHPRHENWLFSGQMLRVRIPDRSIIHPLFLKYQYQTKEFRKKIENFAVGATRPSLNTRILEEMILLIPPIELQRHFVSIVSEIERLLQNIKEKNLILKETRDTLLPNLVSGLIDVSKLDTGISGD